MKILTNGQYKELLNLIEHKEKSLSDTIQKNYELEKEITNLQKDLEYAKDLKGILERIIPSAGSTELFATKTYVDNMFEIKISDNILQYTDDILGGKVIKQEGNKCLVIAKDGTVKTGLTKAKVDKGYSYKLVRE